MYSIIPNNLISSAYVSQNNSKIRKPLKMRYEFQTLVSISIACIEKIGS